MSSITAAYRLAASKTMDVIEEFYLYIQNVLDTHGNEGLSRRIEWDDGTSTTLVEHLDQFFKTHEGFISGYPTSRRRLLAVKTPKPATVDDEDKDEIAEDSTPDGTKVRLYGFAVFLHN